MGKKQYITPKIIDLSLEAITGVGARSCQAGDNVGYSSCTDGLGATSGCTDGAFVSAGCTGGDIPHQSGGYCGGGSAAGTICDPQGGSASGAYGKCYFGNAATGMCFSHGASGSYSFCDTGPTEASYCSNGPTQVPHGSS
ncbi:hypothetical protein [uncultured Methanospirillum sp.]|uniref:hypothetical protein n=1 Tax=uncultured Methanospirillum sp. TaxID=262503 RepID=UPI0029C8474F|nr:hypothetical protein [uncultured Methanospirillum sp.]